jgi:hypothetical protein
VPWSLSRRVAFRFAVLVAALIVFPFPCGWVPGTAPLASLLDAPYRWAVEALASLFGLPTPSNAPTGSGDTMFEYLRLLAIAIAASGGTIVWSIVDRRRASYARLAAAMRVWLRAWVGAMMLVYGVSKLVEGQFHLPSHYELDLRVGDKSPMGLLWTFMGYSRPYTIFTGLAEIAAGVLLLCRRTATIGALVAIAVMTHVVILNFCYDVPVKLFSSELLLAAIAIAAPDLRRLITAALGRATAEVPPRPRGSARVERARAIAKAVLVASVALQLIGLAMFVRRPPATPIDGAWDVERFVLDGVERAPLATDGTRWSRLFVASWGVGVRLMTDDHRVWRATVDDTTIVLRPRDGTREVWRYARPDDEHLVIDGARLHVTLVRVPEGLLMTRGFHWIQEEPFNR